MNVAVLSESPADDGAIRELLKPLVLLNSDDGADVLRIRSRGWPAVLNVLPAVIKQLHYHSTADALVVVVDSDDSTPHGHGTDAPSDCRFCRVVSTVQRELGILTAVPGRRLLRTAVGLRVPAIEAWYLCGVDATVSEAAWANGRRTGVPPYTREELKRRVYGTSIPSLSFQKRVATSHGVRLAADLSLLDTWFPAGCGTMLDAVRSWRSIFFANRERRSSRSNTAAEDWAMLKDRPKRSVRSDGPCATKRSPRVRHRIMEWCGLGSRIAARFQIVGLTRPVREWRSRPSTTIGFDR